MLNNIKLHNDVITDPEQIKNQIAYHFENWTKLNNTNTDEWKLWQNQYIPKSSIYSTWYEGLLEHIMIEEVTNTI